MENQPKLNSSKEVIAFLAERFPHCFSAEGEARPLKIGPRFYVSTSKSIIKALINMHSFEIQLSPIG